MLMHKSSDQARFDGLLHDFAVKNHRLVMESAGDIHGELSKFSRFVQDAQSESDLSLVIADGDYLDEPSFDEELATKKIGEIFDTVRGFRCPVLVLGGNYDPMGTAARVAQSIGKPIASIGCRLTDSKPYPGNHLNVSGYDFIGVEGSNPINGRFPGERPEPEIKWALQQAAHDSAAELDRTILVSHVPPYNMGSRNQLGTFGLPSSYWGKHVGSTALMEFIEEKKPLMHISGHIHEGAGVTLLLSCSGKKPTLEDYKMQEYQKVAVLLKKQGTRATVCVNHGTLEHWTYMRYIIAETDQHFVIEISKRRIGGKDPFAKLGDIFGRKKKGEIKYDKIYDPDNSLEEILT